MALHLTKADALFVHIPKCGGFFVEEVLKANNIAYTKPNPINNVCPRHGKKEDYAKAAFTFCSVRPLDPWMLSYWRFHMRIKNKNIWQPGVGYPHKVLGPPMTAWQSWRSEMEGKAVEYLRSMQDGCDALIQLDNIDKDLSGVLQRLGYDITEEQVAAVPRANVTKLNIELGGGDFPYGHGYANVDIASSADFKWDLDTTPYPFPDASVDAIYSSHCFEHLKYPHRAFQEVARICKVGASVMIKVPHPGNHMAMCPGHKYVIGPMMIENMDVHFPELHWKGARRLKLKKLTYGPTPWMDRAKKELPFLAGLNDQTIMRWIPNTCHESQFLFTVQKNNVG